jgi:hypothetical protein
MGEFNLAASQKNKSVIPESSVAGELVGVNSHYTVDVSSDFVVIPEDRQNCKGFRLSSDSASAGYATLKFDFIPDGASAASTTTDIFNVGEFIPWRNISKVYKVYTGTTATTAQVMKDDGSGLVLGIKLVF